MRLKLDADMLGLSSIVERISHVQVKDCFKDEEGETIYFVVGPGEIGKAIGKNGENIRRIQQELGKKVRMVGFAEEVEQFIRNFIHPLNVKEIVPVGSILEIRDDNRKTKSLLIGRDGRNIKLLNRAVKRFFNVDEVKVV
jgi:N utilization substance protein A